MSVTLTERRRVPTPRRFQLSHAVVPAPRAVEPARLCSVAPTVEDDELKQITWSVACMVGVAIAPLILFFVLTYLYPGIFQISVTPT